jgi:orotate phosphoribosyltransferase
MKSKSIIDLRSLLASKALILGPITLSNGSISNHYFDCKRVTLSPEGAELVGEAVFDAIRQLTDTDDVAAIGGLSYGADPIVIAAMLRARQHGVSLSGFCVRKEAKGHGTKNLVENAPKRGTNVVIVDDVVTAGGSVLKAVEAAEQIGCNVVAVITLVDRLEGGSDRIKARVKRYHPLYTLDDFRSEIAKCPMPTKNLELVSAKNSR